jgi:hypothetical protein
MNEVETDERDTLSECHRDYMARYVEFERLRQVRASASFLKERADAIGRSAAESAPESILARLCGS